MNILIRIQPQKTLKVSIQDVAKLLGISPKKIVRIENWANVLFVHRRDIGGQFISYRRLRNWKNAVAMTINNCYRRERLKVLWRAIYKDSEKYAKQYQDGCVAFLRKVFAKQWTKVFYKEHERFQARKNKPGYRSEEQDDFRW